MICRSPAGDQHSTHLAFAYSNSTHVLDQQQQSSCVLIYHCNSTPISQVDTLDGTCDGRTRRIFFYQSLHHRTARLLCDTNTRPPPYAGSSRRSTAFSSHPFTSTLLRANPFAVVVHPVPVRATLRLVPSQSYFLIPVFSNLRPTKPALALSSSSWSITVRYTPYNILDSHLAPPPSRTLCLGARLA